MEYFDRWKKKALHLKLEAFTVYLACRDPRVPWYVKILALCVVGYAFSPIDLIPDFIPILGYLDDLILIPIGISIVIHMIPHEVLEECRKKAEQEASLTRPRNWIAALLIISIWLLFTWLIISLFLPNKNGGFLKRYETAFIWIASASY